MRIRTIKPEFWVSENIGKLTRDARLLFIGLWSFADDSGRGRGALPAISGALFPYDSDAAKRLDSWFCELEKLGMVRRYFENGSSYYDIPKWLEHQKIEKPSRSRFPPFTEHSPTIHRTLPDISPLDQGSGNGGIRERGNEGEEWGVGEIVAGATAKKVKTFKNWTIEDLKTEIQKANTPEVMTSQQINDFTGYWAEPTPGGKLRISKQDAWDTHRRMLAWVSKDNTKSPQQPRLALGQRLDADPASESPLIRAAQRSKELLNGNR